MSVLAFHKNGFSQVVKPAVGEALPVELVGGGASDGAIVDGASSVKATVKDYANANPLTVVLVDTNGDPYTASGSSGTPSSIFHRVSTGSTNAVNVKASAGTLRSIRVFNKADYPIYVKLHNTAGTPTAGSGVIETVGIQAGRTETHDLSNGATYSTGIALTIVRDMADAGTTPVLAEDCVVDVFYN